MPNIGSEYSGGFLDDRPWTGSLEATIGGILIPLLYFIIHNFLHNRKPEPEDSMDNTVILRFSKFLIKKSGCILLVTLPVAILMGLNQLSYARWNLRFDGDLSYYIRYNLPEYDRIQAIDIAERTTSYRNLVGNDYYASTHRRLASSSSITIAYHRKDWNNVLTKASISHICATESKLKSEIDCLKSSTFTSAIPIFTPTGNCSKITGKISDFSSDQISSYFQDDFLLSNPESDVMFSYVDGSTCQGEHAADLFKEMNNLALGDIEISFTEDQLLVDDLNTTFLNTSVHLGFGYIFASLVIIFVMRGLICGLTTVLCIVISMVTAAGLLPIFGYETFSMFNALAAFVLFVLGGNTVLMFHSSWRRTIKAGDQATPDTLLESYLAIGGPFLCIICVAWITLFVNIASPVIIFGQLGIFFGISLTIFYFEFHYVVIPMWLLTSRWTFSEEFHTEIDSLVKEISFGLFFWNHDDETVDQHAPAALPDTVPSVNITSVRVLQSIYDAEAVFHDPDRPDDVDSDAEWEEPQPTPPASPRGSTGQIQLTTTGRGTHSSSVSSISQLGSTTTSRSGSPRMHHSDSRADAASVSEFGSPRSYAESVAELVSETGTVTQSNAGNNGNNPGLNMPSSPRADPVLFSHDIDDFDSQGNLIPRRKGPSDKYIGGVYCYRVVVVTAIAFAYLVVYYLTRHKVTANLRSLEYFSLDSNLGEDLRIIGKYKSSFLLESAPLTVFAPTPSPSPAPSKLPSQTFSPSLVPSVRPTSRPSVSLAPTSSSFQGESSTDYTVNCCYGYEYEKDHIDGDIEPVYDVVDFQRYVKAAKLLLSDTKTFCVYVNQHRDYLNIHPSWNMQRDCLYDQLYSTCQSTAFTSQYSAVSSTYGYDLLLYWASKSSQASKLLGVRTNTSVSNLYYEPTWLCMNFSIRSNLSSLSREASLIEDLSTRWETAFHSYGGRNASFNGVPLLIGSDAFSEASSYNATYESVFLGTILAIASFIGLLFIITRDLRHVLVTAVAIYLIVGCSGCVVVNVISSSIDILDFIILFILTSMIVYFPIYMIMDYRHEKILGVASASQRFGNSVSPTVSSSSFYMRHALLGPLTLTILMCLPFLLVETQFVRRIGIYGIIIAGISYLVTVLVLPSLISLANGITSPSEMMKFIGIGNGESWWFSRDSQSNTRLSALSLEYLMQLHRQAMAADSSRASSPNVNPGRADEENRIPRPDALATDRLAIRRMLSEVSNTADQAHPSNDNYLEPNSISGRFTGTGIDAVISAENSSGDRNQTPVDLTNPAAAGRLFSFRQFFVGGNNGAGEPPMTSTVLPEGSWLAREDIEAQDTMHSQLSLSAATTRDSAASSRNNSGIELLSGSTSPAITSPSSDRAQRHQPELGLFNPTDLRVDEPTRVAPVVRVSEHPIADIVEGQRPRSSLRQSSQNSSSQGSASTKPRSVSRSAQRSQSPSSRPAHPERSPSSGASSIRNITRQDSTSRPGSSNSSLSAPKKQPSSRSMSTNRSSSSISNSISDSPRPTASRASAQERSSSSRPYHSRRTSPERVSPTVRDEIERIESSTRTRYMTGMRATISGNSSPERSSPQLLRVESIRRSFSNSPAASSPTSIRVSTPIKKTIDRSSLRPTSTPSANRTASMDSNRTQPLSDISEQISTKSAASTSRKSLHLPLDQGQPNLTPSDSTRQEEQKVDDSLPEQKLEREDSLERLSRSVSASRKQSISSQRDQVNTTPKISPRNLDEWIESTVDSFSSATQWLQTTAMSFAAPTADVLSDRPITPDASTPRSRRRSVDNIETWGDDELFALADSRGETQVIPQIEADEIDALRASGGESAYHPSVESVDDDATDPSAPRNRSTRRDSNASQASSLASSSSRSRKSRLKPREHFSPYASPGLRS
jgi:hypothetical protein